MTASRIVQTLMVLGVATGLSQMTAGAAEPDYLSGEWVGSYMCNQGLTALTLTIEPDGEQWSGVFAFGPDKDNKTVPHGSYDLVITKNEGSFHMEPGLWIEQPEGYTTVALDGSVSKDLMMLAGEVRFEGCTRFATARTTPLPVLATSKTK